MEQEDICFVAERDSSVRRLFKRALTPRLKGNLKWNVVAPETLEQAQEYLALCDEQTIRLAVVAGQLWGAASFNSIAGELARTIAADAVVVCISAIEGVPERLAERLGRSVEHVPKGTDGFIGKFLQVLRERDLVG